MISYEKAPDVEAIAKRIISTLSLDYLDQNRLHFYRSRGSRSRRVQARIHGMGRIWFDALQMTPHYIIEVISEEYDRLAQPERERVIIHELMHIPSKFSGGFVPHKGRINRKTVERMYRAFLESSGSGSLHEEVFF
ncbi:MAG: metallopeptidase [Nitrososphaerota archaeon]|nr:metallopeptidase [Nitrososphaerota archaeon]